MTETKRLLLTRALPVPAARAFAAWTDAAEAVRWWGGWEPGTAPVFTSDPRPGGAWRFAMNFDGGTQWVGGTYLEVDAPGRLVFDFNWEGTDSPATPVVLELVDRPDGTSELRLDHDISLGSNACEEGWGWSLGCFVDHLTALAAAGDQG